MARKPIRLRRLAIAIDPVDVEAMASGEISGEYGFIRSGPFSIDPQHIVAVDWTAQDAVITYWESET